MPRLVEARRRRLRVCLGARRAASPSRAPAATSPPRRRCWRSSGRSTPSTVDAGVRTNAILPSVIDTPANRESMPERRPVEMGGAGGDRAGDPLPDLRRLERPPAARPYRSTAAPERSAAAAAGFFGLLALLGRRDLLGQVQAGVLRVLLVFSGSALLARCRASSPPPWRCRWWPCRPPRGTSPRPRRRLSGVSSALPPPEPPDWDGLSPPEPDDRRRRRRSRRRLPRTQRGGPPPA